MGKVRISFTKIWAVLPQVIALFEDGVEAMKDGKVDETERERILGELWGIIETVRKK